MILANGLPHSSNYGIQSDRDYRLLIHRRMLSNDWHMDPKRHMGRSVDEK